MTLPVLSLLETRVLGVLVEKQHTVPDTYPLTLLALTAGCNQKTSRDPIVNASEAEVQSTIDRLKTLSLVVESSGGRVMRYAHNVGRVLAIPSQAIALMAALMLRGPQTIGELRINCDRLHRFADVSAVEGVPARARRPARRRARGRNAAPARRARNALGASALGPARGGGRSRTRSRTKPETARSPRRRSPHSRPTSRNLQEELATLKAVVARLCAELGAPGP